MGKYDSFSLRELRKELSSRGARLSGRKKELIERLESYDRNQNFGAGPSNIEEKFEMVLPDNKSYRDVTSKEGFPPVTQRLVDVYLEPFSASLKAGKRLYLCKFLLFIRSSPDEGMHFIKSQCRAEMKKSVIYNIDMMLSDKGHIEEAQCECAAGLGPEAHCKHVCALLCGLIQLSTEGVILTEAACTSQLQTFHRPSKIHHGSPVKANNLHLGKRIQKEKFSFDPRPRKYRNMEGYRDFVQNLTINNCFSPKVPFSQLCKPANPYALDVDHDYLEKLGSDTFLELVSLTSISHGEIQKIEQDTRDQNLSLKWRSEHRKRITSSNFGRICKLTNRANKLHVAQSLMSPPKLSSVKAIKHGKKFESVAIEQYKEKFNLDVKTAGLHISSSHPFLATTPDGLVGTDKLVEVKCPFSAKDKEVNSTTVPYLREEDGILALDRNHNYFYQVQGQLLLTGRTTCDFVVYTFKDMKVFTITSDDDFQKVMLEKLIDFFNNHFKPAFLDMHYFRRYNEHGM